MEKGRGVVSYVVASGNIAIVKCGNGVKCPFPAAEMGRSASVVIWSPDSNKYYMINKNMEPITTSILTTILAHAGKKALDLGQVFAADAKQGESKIKLFFQKLYQKPLAWIFSMLFAPFILAFAIGKTLKDFPKQFTVIMGIKIITMLIGFCLAGTTVFIAGSYLGTIAGLFLIKNLFGWSAAIGFILGTTFSVTCTIIFQIIVFNAMCFLFLKITKNSVIASVYDEYINNKTDKNALITKEELDTTKQETIEQ